MKKRVGIIIPSSKSGGVFQYAMSIIDGLASFTSDFDFTVFHYAEENHNFFPKTNKKSIDYKIIPNNSVGALKKMFHFLGIFWGIKGFIIKSLDHILNDAQIDILIVPTPFVFDIPLSVPYIVSIPDYMDKYYPNLPDYPLKTRIIRDIVYSYYCSNSILAIADSISGMNDIHKFSKIKEGKIRVIPYIPPNYVLDYEDMGKEEVEKLVNSYNLPEKFIFYPAQFWYQKNHVRLLQALHMIKQKYDLIIPLVLIGNAKGNKIYQRVHNELFKMAEKLGITSQVIYLGYMNQKETVALYKKSVALVFPTLIGPTSIPPLEAMVLGTPILCSNLFSMPDQIGDAGVFFNPFDISDMAEKIHKVWINEDLRKLLVSNGYKKAANLSMVDYAGQWKKVIEESLLNLR